MGSFSNILISFPSGGELILVVLVILLLFGADKIPEVARMFGKGMREFRKATDDIKREFNEETKEIKEEIETEKENLTEKIQDFKNELKANRTKHNNNTSTQDQTPKDA